MSLGSFVKYFRLRLFYWLLGPFSNVARRRRMRMFCDKVRVSPGDRILDLGGHPDIWNHVDIPLRITIVNLPGCVVEKSIKQHQMTFLEGDACDLQGFAPDDFDIVYSNSVIEHVGPLEKQTEFAAQVKKFNAKFWVQTPSKWFPIEAHCGMPLWWFYPESWRKHILDRWSPKLPDWTEMVRGTRVLEISLLRSLFPQAKLSTERFLGWPKSYVVWKDSK